MFGSCSSFNDSDDEEEDSLPTSSPRPTRPTDCNKNDSNQHYSQSPRCIFQRSPFLNLQSNDNELMSRLSTLPMLDSISSAHKIGMKQQESSTSSKILPPSPPRRRILPIPPSNPQLVTTTTTIPTTEDTIIPQSSSSSKRPSGSCLRRSRFSFPSELSEIAARNVDYVLSDSKSVSFYSQVSVLEFENDDDTDMEDSSSGMKVESWFKNFSRGFGIES